MSNEFIWDPREGKFVPKYTHQSRNSAGSMDDRQNRGGDYQNRGQHRGGQNMGGNRGGQFMEGNRGGQNMRGNRGAQSRGRNRGGQNRGGNRGVQNMGGNSGGQYMEGNRGGQNMGGYRGGQHMEGNRGGQNMRGNSGGQYMEGNRGGQNMGGNIGGQNRGVNRGGQNRGGNRGRQNRGGNIGSQNRGGSRGGQSRGGNRGFQSGNREEQEFPRDSGYRPDQWIEDGNPHYPRDWLLPTPPEHQYPYMGPGPGPVPPSFYHPPPPPPPPVFPPPLRPMSNLIPGKDRYRSTMDIPNLPDGPNQGNAYFQKEGNRGRKLPRSTSTPNVNNQGRNPQPNRQPGYKVDCSFKGARGTNVGGRTSHDMNYPEDVRRDDTGDCFEEQQRENNRSRRGRMRGKGYRGRGNHRGGNSYGNADLDNKQDSNAENDGDGVVNRRGKGGGSRRLSRRGHRAKRGRGLKVPNQGFKDFFDTSDENSSISGSTLSLASGVSERSEKDVTYDLKLDDLDVARIPTLRNRQKRYKFRLGEMHKMDKQESDKSKIQAFEEALVAIKHAIDKRKTSEQETSTSKRKSGDKDDVVDHEISNPIKDTYDNLENEKSITVKLPRKPTTMSVKKGMVSFNPKRNQKKKPKATPDPIVLSSSSSKESVSSFEDEIREIDWKVETEKEPKKTFVSKAQNKIKVREQDNNQIDALMSQLDGLCNIPQMTEEVLQNLDKEKKTDSKKKVKAKGKQAVNKNTESPSPGPKFVFTDVQSKHIQSETVRPNKSKQKEPRQTASSQSPTQCMDKDKENTHTIREPDVNDVFKFLVKKLAAEASIEAIIRESGLFPAKFDVGKWFRSNRNRFTLIERNGEIVNVMAFNKNATYCLDYITKRSCDKPDCQRYHVCKDWLSGYCVFGDDGCKFSHDTLDRNSRNLSISKQFGYDTVFTNSEIWLILKVRYPRVCVAWNEEAHCGVINCTGLHICQRFLLGTCFEDREACPFSHDKDSLHNKAIIEAYRMDKWNDNVFKRMVYIVRSPRVALDNPASGQEETEIMQHTEPEKSHPKIQEEPLLLPIQERHRTPKGMTTDKQAKQVPHSKKETASGATKRQRKRTDGISLSSDNLGDNFFICDASLTEQKCTSKSCRYKHLEERMPYLWQIKAFGMWSTFPLSEVIEFAYCNKENKADTELERDSNIYLVEVKFDPNLHAIVNMAGIKDGQDYAEVRRLSTPSYLTGEFASKTYRTQWRWYYVNELGAWDLYEPNMQYTLEQKFLAGQKEYLFSRENYRFKYQLSFNTMTQTNLDTGKCRAIIRRPLFISRDTIDRGEFGECMKAPPTVPTPLPPGWVPWDLCHPFEFVKLSPESAVYKDVAKSFFRTLDDQRYVIDDIFRVQNHVLWSSFCNEENVMQANLHRSGRDTAVVDKRALFHGTDSLNAVRGIAINNFDFRISGKNGTVYGNGAYFARDAKYSNSYTEIRNQERYMFRASVLVGEFTKGQKDYGRPPSRHGNDHELYDSCVDNVDFPTVFVSFDRAKCYPEYLITYHDSQPPAVSYDDLQTPKRRPAPRAPTSIGSPIPTSPTSPTSPAVPSGVSSSYSHGAAYPYGAPLVYPTGTVDPNLEDPYANRQPAARGSNEAPKLTKKEKEGCCMQ